MADHNRPTLTAVQMKNAHVEPPLAGQRVWALTHGNKVVEVEWKTDSIRYFDAWYPYVKVPQEIKDLQTARMLKQPLPEWVRDAKA